MKSVKMPISADEIEVEILDRQPADRATVAAVTGSVPGVYIRTDDGSSILLTSKFAREISLQLVALSAVAERLTLPG